MLNHCSGADLTQVKYGFIPISLSVLFYFHVCSCWTAATWMAQLSPWKVSSVKKKSWAAWRSHCKNPSRYLIENLFLYHTGIDDTLHDFRPPNPPYPGVRSQGPLPSSRGLHITSTTSYFTLNWTNYFKTTTSSSVGQAGMMMIPPWCPGRSMCVVPHVTGRAGHETLLPNGP